MLNLIHDVDDINKGYSNSFQLVFDFSKILTKEAELKDSENFFINIFGTVLPGVSIGVVPIRWMGATTKRPDATIDFSTWSTEFMVDAKMKSWLILFKWMTWLNNNKDKYAEDFPKYCVDASLLVKDNWKRTIQVFRFIDIWPSDLGQITLSNRNDGILESSVTFAYDRFEPVYK